VATRTKAKRKVKARRKKTAVTKPATRKKATTVKKTRKIRKKPLKKRPVRRVSRKKARSKVAVKPPPVTTPVQPETVRPTPGLAAQPTPPAEPGERIGVVSHYYSHLSVAIIRLESGTLRVGDVIHIRGHTTDFSQKVESLEVSHAPVTEVGPNEEFGLKVVEHAREHDVVFKVSEDRSPRMAKGLGEQRETIRQ
jgi:Elongation factor Tu domain 2